MNKKRYVKPTVVCEFIGPPSFACNQGTCNGR